MVDFLKKKATLCLMIVALLTLNATIFDLAYYGALAGTSMALLTPDLWEPFPSFPTVQFFVAHGLVLVGALYLVWSGQARPRPGSIWKAMLGLNTFAAIAGTFDLFFKTNYMYLRAKPRNPSLFDFFSGALAMVLSSIGGNRSRTLRAVVSAVLAAASKLVRMGCDGGDIEPQPLGWL